MRERKSSSILISLLSVCVFVLGLVGGCSSRGWSKIGKDEMRPLLIEMALLNSALQQEYTPDSLRQGEYAALLARYGYTQADWDSSIMWYARYDMTLMHDFYRVAYDSLEATHTRLKQQHEQIVAEEARQYQLSTYNLDSVNFLPSEPSYHALDGGLLYRSFDLSPGSPYDSTRRLNFSVRLTGLPELDSLGALRLYLYRYLKDSTTRLDSLLILRSGIHSIEVQQQGKEQVVRCVGHIKGILPLRSSGQRIVAMDSFSLVRYSLPGSGYDPNDNWAMPEDY